MSMPHDDTRTDETALGTEPTRKRPKPGERRVQILQALAAMLEQPGSERITTAALAHQLEVSEAALYRHFASKAQMFEALIDFIEQSIFGFVGQLEQREPDARQRARKLLSWILQFAEKNPGMCRVMVGDALVLEHERLQQRVNLLFEKLESQLRQCLRQSSVLDRSVTPTVHAQADAALMMSWCTGRLHAYARSGFKRLPSEHLEHHLSVLLP
jgi:TetR/AcrR family transcriptional regulator